MRYINPRLIDWLIDWTVLHRSSTTHHCEAILTTRRSATAHSAYLPSLSPKSAFSENVCYLELWTYDLQDVISDMWTTGTRRIFSRSVQWGSEGRKFPARSRGSSPVRANDIFSKWCINTLSTEVSDNICSKEEHFSTFPVPLLPMPVGAHDVDLVVSNCDEFH